MKQWKVMGAAALLTGLLAGGCQSPDCASVRTGTFELVNDNSVPVTIVRNDSLQIETKANTTVEEVYRIFWVDDCTYKAVLHEDSQHTAEKMTLQDTMLIRITDTHEDGYAYSLTMGAIRLEGEMVRAQ
ncbi:MAG: hypothetical protein AAGB22_11190 [Bacteroidota bacterium]